ncbi:acyl-CoA thioesterase domain-containing protein [Sphingomonas sp.]|jgi:hypothetical protein|uniref:acyl-CoA thioesterase domain-containing protein n=1 Tax=Sphingomonas sp. TaxID=28214 RepID=UPI002D7F875D|nr:acyl-CoA thioesterase domain-containing protein [Sphingomonas sp.]HEU0043337.1 acyl-CoA thioesterase domain-containing protein [Sphingomonas sp.]
MDEEAFFRPADDAFQPLPLARGPWNPQSLNGRVVAGLLGTVLEQRHGRAGWLPARMTVDLYRLPGFDPVTVDTYVVREGRRILVVDARFVSGGVDMARATCQFLLAAENAPGEVWKREGWDVPGPDTVALAAMPHAIWDFRPISGAFATAGQRRGWMRELRPMVAGLPLTPFQRVAAACDFASPFAHSGSEGLGYINTDVTLALHRLPAGEWIGFESDYHDADAGVALGQCRLYDETGPIGLATCLALAQKQALKPR